MEEAKASSGNLDYIEMLTAREVEFVGKLIPFSNRSEKISQIQRLQFFKSQQQFVEQNKDLLGVNEKYNLDDYKVSNDLSLQCSLKWSVLTFWGSFTYYVVKIPPTRTMYPELVKCFAFAAGASALYQYYHFWGYRGEIQKTFDEVIKRKLLEGGKK